MIRYEIITQVYLQCVAKFFENLIKSEKNFAVYFPGNYSITSIVYEEHIIPHTCC